MGKLKEGYVCYAIRLYVKSNGFYYISPSAFATLIKKNSILF